MKTYARYKEIADRCATTNDEPSMTDQSGADDTDINVIVKRYGVYGTMPQGAKRPKFGEDFSELPEDLAGFIQTARSIESLKGQLPATLAGLTIEDLLTYTPEAITRLAIPEQKTEETK